MEMALMQQVLVKDVRTPIVSSVLQILQVVKNVDKVQDLIY